MIFINSLKSVMRREGVALPYVGPEPTNVTRYQPEDKILGLVELEERPWSPSVRRRELRKRWELLGK